MKIQIQLNKECAYLYLYLYIYILQRYIIHVIEISLLYLCHIHRIDILQNIHDIDIFYKGSGMYTEFL